MNFFLTRLELFGCPPMRIRREQHHCRLSDVVRAATARRPNAACLAEQRDVTARRPRDDETALQPAPTAVGTCVQAVLLRRPSDLYAGRADLSDRVAADGFYGDRTKNLFFFP